MTTRKYNKVKQLSKMGNNPTTFSTLLQKVKFEIDIDKLTAKQIAKIIDLMYLSK
jgi:hypothetical protein